MAEIRLPTLVAHADWSSVPSKRWMAVGRLTGATYELDAPEPVGQVASLLSRLQQRAINHEPFIVGFDFPIGVPAAYAQCSGIERFLDELQKFGTGRWSTFYNVAISPGEVSPCRPFYPFRPGGTSTRTSLARWG